MWFLPLRLPFKREGFTPLRYDLWFLRLVERLLEGDRQVLSLFRHNPFPRVPPRRVRASLYRYEFASRDERAQSGFVWKRTRVGDYLPPVTLESLRLSNAP
jgi:hypothetical protein